jgi:hypothetical protein
MTCYGPPTTNFIFRNNIVQYNSYGINCPANALTPTSKGNIIIDNSGAIAANGQPATIPFGNSVVTTLAQVGFVDSSQGDWRLSAKSKVKRRATDGNDPGVNFEILTSLLLRVMLSHLILVKGRNEGNQTLIPVRLTQQIQSVPSLPK